MDLESVDVPFQKAMQALETSSKRDTLVEEKKKEEAKKKAAEAAKKAEDAAKKAEDVAKKAEEAAKTAEVARIREVHEWKKKMIEEGRKRKAEKMAGHIKGKGTEVEDQKGVLQGARVIVCEF
jgi:membrane protein involved in colicin uptake